MQVSCEIGGGGEPGGLMRRCGGSWGGAMVACACAALLVATVPGRAAAQVAARADTAAVLWHLAEQLEAEGRDDVAATLLVLIRDRYAETPAARLAVERLAALRGARRGGEGSGRTELMVWGTLYGLWLGAAVPAAAGSESQTAYGLGLLVGGPAGFLAARAYGAGGLTEGQARAITLGGTWGTWQGIGWREVLDMGETPEATFRAAVLGGLAGIGIGSALARASRISAGTATMINFGALWGTWYGLAAAILSGEADDEDGDRLLTMMLVGGDVGLVATALLAPGWGVSRPRARLINVAGLAGLAAGFGLLLLIDPGEGDGWIMLPTLTSAAGLLAGATWTRHYDRPAGVEGGGGGALLERRGGRWQVGELALAPVPLAGPAGRQVPGVRLDVISVRF